jgi:phosphoglycolate phosphatase-like HAD superfamily hydrolase
MPLPSEDWNAYVHVTDSGVISEVLEGARGTGVTPEELEEFERVFLRELEIEYEKNPDAFAEIPGAKAMLEAIGQHDGMYAALATGGMKATALFKLSKIGVDGASMPGAFANDSVVREEIVKRTVQLAGFDTGDIVSVGDAVWDVRTSAALGLRFIGITKESSAERLQAAGATVCLEDYSNLQAFFDAVRTAQVPTTLR